MDRVCMYLRKSRHDEDNEGDTLSRHKSTLLKIAQKQNLNIIKIREEVVSGESLVARPQMLKLLEEVEQGLYDAVLVMDMDRLGRGNMQEQGLILDTFKRAETKIITPLKTYDLSDEWDEEYTEFETFMARRELKIINRRLQRGRVRAVEEGHYLGSVAPYGYERAQIDGKPSLTINEDEANIVRMIFDLYVNKKIGMQTISRRLNQLGVPTIKAINWTTASISSILQNPIYIGKVRWGKRPMIKNKDGTFSRPRIKEHKLADGLHEPIVDEETFYKAQSTLTNKEIAPKPRALKNPLAGLVECHFCGRKMIRRPYSSQPPHIMCNDPECVNKSTRLKYVEERIINSLQEWIDGYKLEFEGFEEESNTETTEKILQALQSELKELDKQKTNLHDLLERGIYDVDTYLERSKILAERIEETENNIKEVEKQLIQEQENELAQHEIIPTVENVLDLYFESEDIEFKNNLLKSVILKAVYKKEKHQVKDEFELTLYPKIDKYRY